MAVLATYRPAAAQSPAGPSFQPAGNLSVVFQGDPALVNALSSGQAQPLSLASADLNADGVADLVVGYGLSGALNGVPDEGAVAVYLGNHDAFVQGIAGRSLPPFQPTAQAFALPEPPDFLLAGDFNRDGTPDLLVAAHGGTHVYLLAGDGTGNFGPPQPIQLPGSLDVMTAGRIGLPGASLDVVIGVTAPTGSELLIYKDALGGLNGPPLAFPLSGPATSLAIGYLDQDIYPDVAIAAQGNIVILHGHDWAADLQAGTFQPSQWLEPLSLPFSAKSLTLGSFVYDSDGKTQIAVLTASGTISVIARGQLNLVPPTAADIQAMRVANANHSNAAPPAWQPSSSQSWSVVQTANAPASPVVSGAGLVTMETHTAGAGHGLLLVDSSSSRIHMLASSAPSAAQLQSAATARSAAGLFSSPAPSAQTMTDTTIPAASSPVAALPMKLSGFARPGLVSLQSGQVAPAITIPAGDPTLTVNRNDDITPRGTGVTCINPASVPPGDCTLREAIIDANAGVQGGPPYTIKFAASTDGTPIVLTIPGKDNASANGDLDINTNIDIEGNGSANTIIQGNFPVLDGMDEKIFGINQDGTHLNLAVTINNVTVEGGRNSVAVNDSSFEQTGGGIDFFLTGTSGNYTLSNCVVTNNTNVHSYGGGVNIDSTGSPVGTLTGAVQISNCTISNNRTLGSVGGDISEGGGLNLFADNHNVTITNSTISGNQVQNGGEGGGLYIRHTNGGTIGIHGSTITGNAAGARGGGIRINGIVQSVTVDQGSVISNNVSGSTGNVGEGGGVYVANGPSASTTISQANIVNNSLSAASSTLAGGGGIGQGTGNATVQFSRIVGNNANGGSGNGYHKDSNAGIATAIENWWGCNAGPGSAGCDTAVAAGGTLTLSPRLVLSNTASPGTILTTGTSAISANFSTDSNSVAVSGSNLGVFLGIPISFHNAVLGTLSGAATSLSATATATATFNPTGAGVGHVDATVDNQTVTANITINPGPATHFSVSAPASATAGSAFSITVTAQDATNSTDTNYSGTVHFTSNDGAAVLPADATLTNGVGTFSVTLKTTGSQTITATDTVSSSITGTSNAITVNAAAATHLAVSAPAGATAGAAFSITVTAQDQFNNTAAGYAGIVHFTSTDGTATLPANSPLPGGVAIFSVTLKTLGNQAVTATDTVVPSITGTSGTIAVAPGPATHFTVSASSTNTAGTPFPLTVTALDAFNNTVVNYSNFVHFTSSDPNAVLPADSTLAAGTGTFSATLKAAGGQTITATEVGNPSVTGASNAITVLPGPTTHFAVAAPSTATAGFTFSFTVTAQDQFNNTTTGYTGVVHFTSSDSAATLPPSLLIVNGTGTFPATLDTAGTQTISATDGTFSGTSNNISVSPAAASHFSVIAPASAAAGAAFSVTVTALDPFNNTATNYAGVVHFTSTDGSATLPANSLLTNGVGTFSVTLRTAGNQTITATDTITPSTTGTSGAITVNPAATTHFAVAAPATATAGTSFSVTVTALDAFNNPATTYPGAVRFSSSDGSAILPANSPLTNGVGTFSATLKTAGNQTITATDTGTPSITGTSGAIAVAAVGATHFVVSAPATATAGAGFSFTVTALDTFNNTATGYSGTVHFTSSDGAATLPANSTLTNGVGTLSATLKTAGSQTITATDSVTSAIAGTSNTITVSAAAATHFTVVAPATAIGGSPFNFSVTALDQFSNAATSYAGTVHFTSTDGTATLPANSTLANGTGTFPATLRTAGSQTITATDTVTGTITGNASVSVSLPADLTIAKSHTGNFFQGQAGATYTLTSSNVGANATVGTVTVADVLPASLTATSIIGSGWACSVGTLSCSRNDVLAAGAAYPAITVTVTVASNAPASVTNSATVSGGGEINLANDAVSDPTTITAPPDFSLSFTLSTITVKAGQSASYALTIASQNSSFTSPITLSATGLPAGTTFTFNPSSVTPGATSASSTLTVTTTAGDPFLSGNVNLPQSPKYSGLLLALAGMIFFIMLPFRTRRPLAARGAFACLALAASVIYLGGCVGSQKNFQSLGTPAGTYTVTVTATAGAVQHSAPVTLIVQAP